MSVSNEVGATLRWYRLSVSRSELWQRTGGRLLWSPQGTAATFSREQPHWIRNKLLQYSFNSSIHFTPPQPGISYITLMNVYIFHKFCKIKLKNTGHTEAGDVGLSLRSDAKTAQAELQLFTDWRRQRLISWATEMFVGKQTWREWQQQQQTPTATIVSSSGGSETGARVDRRLRNEIKHVSFTRSHFG